MQLGNTRDKDFSPTGIKLDGPWENDRNADGFLFFKDMIREAFGVQDVICGHHLLYVTSETRPDGFVYQIVEEIPSADALLFDHEVARKIWGENFKDVLTRLAVEPVETRDQVACDLFYARRK